MLKIIKQLFCISITCLSLALSTTSFAQLSDKVIAIVDDDVILQSELDERMAQIQQRIDSGEIPRNIPPAQLQEQMLDQLILENLQMQLAVRSGIRIDDNRLNQTLTQIAQQNNMTFDEFRAALNADGQYLNFREQIRKDMMINNLQSGTINQRLNISRQEIENYLNSEASKAEIAPEYRVQHILVPVENALRNDQQKELAELLYNQLTEGADIMELASSRQILGLPVSGGDLSGWRKTESLPTPFRAVVPELETGEISEPFTSASGFHIVKLIDKRGGSDLKLKQTKIRHIMIAPNEIRTLEQSEEFIKELYQRIEDGEDFADLARVYTSDPTSMVSGGDIGWINEGQLPVVYEETVKQLEIGERTRPFQVGDAWHIAEVIDRRIEDVTEDNRRFQAQQIIRERKYENELENWLSEIHDTAYIDIKIGESD